MYTLHTPFHSAFTCVDPTTLAVLPEDALFAPSLFRVPAFALRSNHPFGR